MNPDELKLLELLETNEEAGTVYFNKRRVLIFDADAMGLLRKELIDSLGLDGARTILARFGYARGYHTALIVKELVGPQETKGWWEAGRRLNAIEGIVSARLIRMEIDPERGVFDVEAEWMNSYEAAQHLAHVGTSDVPVCWTLAGYASGYSSAVLGKNVIFRELECVGRGDPRCLVVGKAVSDDMGEEFNELLEKHGGSNFGLEIRRLMHELDERSKALAAQEERVRVLETEVFVLKEAFKETYDDEMIGASPGIRRVLKDVERVADSDASVLITGETGTGKELVARAIHARSRRAHHPLIVVNCAALPAGLIESEIFGHEKGAFTGAIARKLGRFELANHGTIFLDEVGELPLDVQVKFLRVLQRGEYERVGGTQTLTTDVRVIAATNQPLEQRVAEGKFRADLFYRVNVFPVRVPPLRDRPEDIVLLTNYFVRKYRARFSKPIISISQESVERLRAYSWPGNVRELEHIVERAILLSDGEVLTIDLPLDDGRAGAGSGGNGTGRLATLQEAEREHIERVLRHTKGMIAGKGGAAEILGLPSSTLRSRMKKLGIRLERATIG